MPSDQPLESIGVMLLVARTFETLGIPYFLGGSFASSFQGEPRATNDIDFVVDLKPAQVAALESALGQNFEVDAPSLLDAVRQRSSWNIYHLPSMTKIDLFILKAGAFDQSEFNRRRSYSITDDQHVVLKSPEDTILRKLVWFVEGGEVSDKQWRDIVEVLRVSGPTLENGYLEVWAPRLGVEKLLEKARAEAK